MLRAMPSSVDWKHLVSEVNAVGEGRICMDCISDEDYLELCRRAGAHGLAIFRWKGHLWAERAFE